MICCRIGLNLLSQSIKDFEYLVSCTLYALFCFQHLLFNRNSYSIQPFRSICICSLNLLICKICQASLKMLKVEEKLSKGWGGENAYHVGGYRYLLVDGDRNVSRASPPGKVTTLTKVCTLPLFSSTTTSFCLVYMQNQVLASL